MRIQKSASGSGYDFPLEGERITLGSSADSSIVIDGAEPLHAELVRIGNGYKIVDRHTEMGVQVNGEWIVQKVLAPGDTIVIGRQQMVYCEPPPAAAAPPPAAVSNGSRRKRKTSPAGPIIGVTLIGLSLVIIWFVVGRLGSDTDAAPLPEKYASILERAAADRDQGYLSAARQRLEAIHDVEDPVVAERIRRELDEIERVEELAELARREIELLTEALGRDSVAEIEASIKLFEATFGHLAFLEPDLLNIKRSLEKVRAIEEAGLVALAETDVRDRARAAAEGGDYSTALKLWSRYVPRDDAGRDMERNEIAAIKLKARDEARSLLSIAAAFKSEQKYEQVLDLLAPPELARFKETPLYDALVERASEVEMLAGLVPRGLRPEDLEAAADSGAPDLGEGASRERGPGPPPERPEPAARIAPASAEPQPALAEAEFREVDEAVREWRFDKAVSILQEMIQRAATRGDKNAVSTRVEFVYRQTWFLQDLELHLTDEPEQATRVAVKTRDGAFSGRFHSFMDSKVYIQGDDDIQGFLFEEIEPRCLYALARAYPLQSEEKLNAAGFCLNNGLKTEFQGLAADVSAEGSFKRSIDSFLAMEHGAAAAAVDFGFHLLDGKLVPHQEWRDHVLNREIAALLKMVRSRDAPVRNEGYRGFLDLGPVSFDALEAELRARYVDLARELTGFPETGKLDKLAEVKTALNQAREHALELIFDSERYFYPYGHRQGEYTKVQREVDERIEKVRAIWGNEFQEEIPGPKIKLSAAFLTVRDDLNQVALILGDITRGEFARSANLGYANLLPARDSIVHVRNFALDPEEWETIHASVSVLEYNQRIPTTASRNELEQVLITNQYRMMMGRRALAINELILQAARSHSEWMTLTGTFSHFEDTDERRTPVDRMAQAGYDKGSGENIHMGAGSALGAHQGWYHSSGHHRNMLAPTHTEMACGVAGRYWTQNFGGGSEFSENLITQ